MLPPILQSIKIKVEIQIPLWHNSVLRLFTKEPTPSPMLFIHSPFIAWAALEVFYCSPNRGGWADDINKLTRTRNSELQLELLTIEVSNHLGFPLNAMRS